MISDDSNLKNFSSDSLDNYGTYMEHLSDLYEYWSTGLEILDRYDTHASEYDIRKRELEAALRLLRIRMTRTYDENYYRRIINGNTEGTK